MTIIYNKETPGNDQFNINLKRDLDVLTNPLSETDKKSFVQDLTPYFEQSADELILNFSSADELKETLQETTPKFNSFFKPAYFDQVVNQARRMEDHLKEIRMIDGALFYDFYAVGENGHGDSDNSSLSVDIYVGKNGIKTYHTESEFDFTDIPYDLFFGNNTPVDFETADMMFAMHCLQDVEPEKVRDVIQSIFKHCPHLPNDGLQNNTKDIIMAELVLLDAFSNHFNVNSEFALSIIDNVNNMYARTRAEIKHPTFYNTLGIDNSADIANSRSDLSKTGFIDNLTWFIADTDASALINLLMPYFNNKLVSQ